MIKGTREDEGSEEVRSKPTRELGHGLTERTKAMDWELHYCPHT